MMGHLRTCSWLSHSSASTNALPSQEVVLAYRMLVRRFPRLSDFLLETLRALNRADIERASGGVENDGSLAAARSEPPATPLRTFPALLDKESSMPGTPRNASMQEGTSREGGDGKGSAAKARRVLTYRGAIEVRRIHSALGRQPGTLGWLLCPVM